MGVSATASVIIGFEIHHDDFWEEWTETDDHLSCPKGHTANAKKGKHCSDCGGVFDHQTRDTTTPTENFAKFCKARKLKPQDTWDRDSGVGYDDQADRNAFDGLEVLVADGYHDSEMCGEPELLILGSELLGNGDILEGGSGGTDELDEKALKGHFDKCRKFANALGIDRPVKLYLTTSCG